MGIELSHQFGMRTKDAKPSSSSTTAVRKDKLLCPISKVFHWSSFEMRKIIFEPLFRILCAPTATAHVPPRQLAESVPAQIHRFAVRGFERELQHSLVNDPDQVKYRVVHDVGDQYAR